MMCIFLPYLMLLVLLVHCAVASQQPSTTAVSRGPTPAEAESHPAGGSPPSEMNSTAQQNISSVTSANVTFRHRLTPASPCTIAVMGRTGFNNLIDAYYTYQGTDGSMPYYYTSSGLYLYYTSTNDWSISDTLGSLTIRAYVMQAVANPSLITSTWNIWNGYNWEQDYGVRSYCSSPA
eukprot:RCo019360